MSGNCACGMAPIAMIPASVMMIEMTKARRGRSMKTLESIAHAPAGLEGSGATRTASPGRTPARPLDGLPPADPLQPLDDHPVATFQAVLDDDVGPLPLADLDAPLLDLALAVDGQHVGPDLVGQERRLRHHQGLLRLRSSTSTPATCPAI